MADFPSAHLAADTASPLLHPVGENCAVLFLAMVRDRLSVCMRLRDDLAQVHDMVRDPDTGAQTFFLTRRTRGSYTRHAFTNSRPEVPCHTSRSRFTVETSTILACAPTRSAVPGS